MRPSIPSSWKKILNSNELPNIAPPDPITEPLTCRAIYNKLLSLEKLPPPTAEKKILEYGFKKYELCKVYLLPFNVLLTKETKLMFHYTIIHRILPTNSFNITQNEDI